MVLATIRLVGCVLRRFHSEGCVETAAALSFATLLSLVPMVVIGAALIEMLPFGFKLGAALERFLLATLLPEKAGAVIAKLLGQFAHRAERVTWIGLGMLGLTALMQMLTIEHAFNAIWKVKSTRPWLRRLAMHLAALLIGPLLFGAALAAVAYLAAFSFGFFDDPRWLRTVYVQTAPVAFLAALLALLYRMVPNRPVAWRHALLAGVLTALAFVGLQNLFALYVVKLPTYAAVYGAFAALPIFLLWLHLSWSAILAGALLTAELPAAARRVA